MSFEDKIQQFKKNIVSGGITDKDGVHHIFSQGLHGQKIDFDLISDDSDLFKQWTIVTAEYIKQNYPSLPEVIVGVANGTNRLATAVAGELDNGITGLVTYKPEGVRNQPIITPETKSELDRIKPKFIVVVEDVGTKGTNSTSVCRSLKEAGYDNFEVLNTWQRSETLPFLDDARIQYKAVIKHVLPSYTKEKCESEGYCAKNWELKGHGK